MKEECFMKNVRRESYEHPGMISKNNVERKGYGAYGEGEYGVCWERVGRKGVGGKGYQQLL